MCVCVWTIRRFRFHVSSHGRGSSICSRELYGFKYVEHVRTYKMLLGHRFSTERIELKSMIQLIVLYCNHHTLKSIQRQQIQHWPWFFDECNYFMSNAQDVVLIRLQLLAKHQSNVLKNLVFLLFFFIDTKQKLIACCAATGVRLCSRIFGLRHLAIIALYLKQCMWCQRRTCLPPHKHRCR